MSEPYKGKIKASDSYKDFEDWHIIRILKGDTAELMVLIQNRDKEECEADAREIETRWNLFSELVAMLQKLAFMDLTGVQGGDDTPIIQRNSTFLTKADVLQARAILKKANKL